MNIIDAYTTRDIVLTVTEDKLEVEETLEIPRFRLTKIYTDNTNVEYSTGEFGISSYCFFVRSFTTSYWSSQYIVMFTYCELVITIFIIIVTSTGYSFVVSSHDVLCTCTLHDQLIIL